MRSGPGRALGPCERDDPRPGETGAEWWSNTRQQEAMHAQLAALGLPPESADDEATIYFHDVSPEVRAQAFQRGEPMQSWTPMTQPWPLSGWPDVPTRVLVGRDDRLFPARFQRQVARDRLAIWAEDIEGGHLVALSRPPGACRTPRVQPRRPRPLRCSDPRFVLFLSHIAWDTYRVRHPYIFGPGSSNRLGIYRAPSR
jgi:pimeloyl-ACP methyl ester carboxylesterase